MQTAPPAVVSFQRRILDIFWYRTNIPVQFEHLIQWGAQNIVGVAASLVGEFLAHRIFAMEVYVREWPELNFKLAMEALAGLSGVALKFVRVGRFAFRNGAQIGGDVFVEGDVPGKIGAFLQGKNGVYALTCSHVLQSGQINDNIQTGGQVLGTLTFKSDLSNPLTANQADCAIIQLAADATNVLPDGTALPTTVASPSEGEAAEIVTFGNACIRAVNVDVRVDADNGSIIRFTGITAVGLEVQSGASGSLVIKQNTSEPIGIVFASSDHFDSLEIELPKQVSLVCDMPAIINSLPASLQPFTIR